ncbi:MAG: alpha/beta fold hydrolase [Acidobacteria bacterium]|nr:alpha/beta fold hydrolase [Acidobacteriota bacterium]
MTLYAWGNPRHFPALPPPTPRYFDVNRDTRVLAACHWQPRPWDRPTIIALHGLNGSSDAHYMKGIAAKAFARGMNAVLLNQRNCRDTEHLCAGLFHSGLTADAAFVIDELVEIDRLPALVVAGYSLGGNLALRLAGEYGAFAPAALKGVAAVSPIIEIALCVRALERPRNMLYEWNFVRDLKRRMRRKHRAWPGRFDLGPLKRVRTVRDFDRDFTAPYFGFADEEDYYHRASAMRVVERIRVPALIIASEDDPFVPVQPFSDPRLTANPAITTVVTSHGGHCAFVGDKTLGEDGYWAERSVVDFAAAVALPADAGPRAGQAARQRAARA